MLDVQHLQKAYGSHVVLKDVSFQVGDCEKVGLLGRNGSGKTTVLRIISGEIEPDAGTVTVGRGQIVGYMRQELNPKKGTSVYEEALTVFSRLLELEQEIASLTSLISALDDSVQHRKVKAALRLSSLQEEYEFRGGYAFRSQTKTVLTGLGFEPNRFDQDAATLSGGEKTRLSLAKLLLEEPDLLLLDEPTNHLDMESVEWLESFLANYKKSVLVVSHDRYFLDRVVTKVVEIDDGVAVSYPGNYTKFVQLKQEAYERQLKEWKLQQREIARQQEIIDRFMQYGLSFHKQAKSKAKLLSKIQRVEKPKEQKSVHIRIESDRSGDLVLLAEDIEKAFGGRQILRRINLRLTRGERVALLGPNGSGKTTLLKILAGKVKPDGGLVRFGAGVKVAFYEQEASSLDPDQDVISCFLSSVEMPPSEARNLLASFLFDGDHVFKRVRDLSGGERSRLRLAIAVGSRPNLILLDEPTNHLDIASIEALEAALEDYEGTLLFVTHDRYFVDKLATRVLELSDGRLTEYLGGYSYYLEKKQDTARTVSVRETSHAPEKRPGSGTYETLKMLRARRAELAKVERLIAEAEESIDAQEQEVARLQEKLADPNVYTDPSQSIETAQQLAESERRLELMLAEWESLCEDRERLETLIREIEDCLSAKKDTLTRA